MPEFTSTETEQPQGGGMFASRIFGVPILVWVAGIALIAFVFLSRRSQTTAGRGAVSESGGGGSATSTTTIDRGAVRIDVTQNPQPKPKVTHRHKTEHQAEVKVPDVLQKQYGTAAETLQDAGLKARRGTPDVGKVTSQSPSAGSKVRKSSVVTLYGSGNDQDKGPNINVG